MAKKVYTWDALTGIFNHVWDNDGKVFHTADKDGVDVYVTHYNGGGYKNIVFKFYGWHNDYTQPLYTARVYSRLPQKYDFSGGQILTAKRNGNKRVIIHA